MKSTRALPGLPPAVSRALRKLGHDLRVARLKRRLPMALVAERAFISRNTLGRVERGDPGASIGIYASVLFVLGMADRIAGLADVRADAIGLAIEDEHLPKRARIPKRRAGRGTS
jgi:transcriptional regulator with XRE-family HTH domain